MAAARFYSSTSGAIDLTADIAASDTGITVSTTSGLPGATPFTLVVDPGQSTEEIVTVTNVSGLTLTVTRGADGSAAQAHSAGVGNVRHMATARDFREPQEHIGASAAVHGVTGSVVGTTDAQTLTNKTLAAPTVTGGTLDSPALADATHTGTTTFTADTIADVPISAKSANAAGLNEVIGQFVDSANKVRAKVTKDGIYVFDADGNILVTLSGLNGRVEATGPVSGTTGTFSGALSSPTVDSLQSADTALDGRLDAIETNLGSQTTFVASSAAKDGKRMHWDNYSSVGASRDGATGIGTFVHGAGFTPSNVTFTYTTATSCRPPRVISKSATEIGIQIVNSDGSANNSQNLSFDVFLGE